MSTPSPPKPKTRKKQPKRVGASTLASNDHAALDAFCQPIHLDEIAFETWERCLEGLDLRVPLWLPVADAVHGGERRVSFCRSTRAAPDAGPARCPASCLVAVPAGAADGQQVRIKGEGDRLANAHGDLIVTIHLKR